MSCVWDNAAVCVLKLEIFRIPAVCQEAAVSVTGAVAAWRRAGRALGLEGLPGEGGAIKETLLLAACCQRTAVSTAVGGVLPTDVAQTVTAGNWTPGDRKREVQLTGRTLAEETEVSSGKDGKDLEKINVTSDVFGESNVLS